MKKIFTLLLVGIICLSGASVHAMEGEKKSFEERKTDREVKWAEKKVKSEERRERLGNLFAKFNPSSLDSFNESSDEHQTFHETRKALNTEFAQGIRNQFKELKENYDNGDITEEEFTTLKDELKVFYQTYRDDAKSLREDKKTEVSVLREEVKAIHDEMKTMKDSGSVDETRMSELLNDVNGILNQHLEINYKYADLIDALRANY